MLCITFYCDNHEFSEIIYNLQVDFLIPFLYSKSWIQDYLEVN